MNKFYRSLARKVGLLLSVALLWSGLPAGALGAAAFPDVDARQFAWALPSIQSMSAKQVLEGDTDGKFYPNRTIKKAEWTKMVYTLFDKYRPNRDATGMKKISYFTDVPESHWAFGMIGDMYDASFAIGGYGLNRNEELSFRPEMEMTRLQLALMLYAFFDNRLIDRRISDNDACAVVMTTFKDIPFKLYTDPEEYRSEAASDGRYVDGTLMTTETQDVYPALMLGKDSADCALGDDPLSNTEIKVLTSLHATGIMTPNEDGYFRPLDRVTRAEAVTILERIYRYLKKNYWLSDYSSIDLDSAGTVSPGSGGLSGGGASSGGTTGSGSGNPFTYNPNTNVIPGSSGGTSWSDKSVVRVVDYFNDQGVITKDLRLNGEIETAVQPQGKKYVQVDLKSVEKVDLYIILDGQVGFVKQEELPITLTVSGVSTVGIRSQQRLPNQNKKTDFTATLSVVVSDEDPGKKKK